MGVWIEDDAASGPEPESLDELTWVKVSTDLVTAIGECMDAAATELTQPDSLNSDQRTELVKNLGEFGDAMIRLGLAGDQHRQEHESGLDLKLWAILNGS